MVERGQHLGLAHETAEALSIAREFLGEELDGHLAVERRVERFPHDTHPTFTEFLDDLIM